MTTTTTTSLILNSAWNQNPKVALITLNRPQVLNALSFELIEELAKTLENFIQHNSQIACVVLTGNEKAFAAGADIKAMASLTPAELIQKNSFGVWDSLADFPLPLIAAVSGLALGGGCELAMACDIILASETAKFGQPEINLGTIPGAGGTQRLIRSIGKSRAMELILSGNLISAQTAQEWGLVSRVIPQETLLQEAYSLAATIAEKSTLALKLAKNSVLAAESVGLREGLKQERQNFHLTFSSFDQKEGMAAFLEKRRPCFENK